MSFESSAPICIPCGNSFRGLHSQLTDWQQPLPKVVQLDGRTPINEGQGAYAFHPRLVTLFRVLVDAVKSINAAQRLGTTDSKALRQIADGTDEPAPTEKKL